MGFQFHKGTIKPSNRTFIQKSSFIFQFHKGTIKPSYGFMFPKLGRKFQFHKGTIKPAETEEANSRALNFNSIKVRLNRQQPTD